MIWHELCPQTTIPIAFSVGFLPVAKSGQKWPKSVAKSKNSVDLKTQVEAQIVGLETIWEAPLDLGVQ